MIAPPDRFNVHLVPDNSPAIRMQKLSIWNKPFLTPIEGQRGIMRGPPNTPLLPTWCERLVIKKHGWVLAGWVWGKRWRWWWVFGQRTKPWNVACKGRAQASALRCQSHMALWDEGCHLAGDAECFFSPGQFMDLRLCLWLTPRDKSSSLVYVQKWLIFFLKSV